MSLGAQMETQTGDKSPTKENSHTKGQCQKSKGERRKSARQ